MPHITPDGGCALPGLRCSVGRARHSAIRQCRQSTFFGLYLHRR
ncbi:hypothetical protein SPAB_00619 [Salmonella enterica subsp. enterica serovar Paratyphi B str. SPB7]|uniref:Uncharacterized protein n=1 Tax=Salmonella paratyphi B (strain ATCC BAA-1250 / SPB7) TaxID=1016998 RepID=A0A6C6YZ44_SALPB|nr:hypothetical protein SPAB_00619 [Salmonella enterica subsp. enterica serovar Paratyphi B str. SPB7]